MPGSACRCGHASNTTNDGNDCIGRRSSHAHRWQHTRTPRSECSTRSLSRPHLLGCHCKSTETRKEATQESAHFVPSPDQYCGLRRPEYVPKKSHMSINRACREACCRSNPGIGATTCIRRRGQSVYHSEPAFEPPCSRTFEKLPKKSVTHLVQIFTLHIHPSQYSKRTVIASSCADNLAQVLG